MTPYPSSDPTAFPGPGQDPGNTVDIAEAARQLGISEAAVKLAIDRGFLRGYYQESNGRWRVRLEYTGAAAPRPERPSAGQAASMPPAPAPPPPAQGVPFYPHAAGMVYAAAPGVASRPRMEAAPTSPTAAPAPVPAADVVRTVETVLREQIAYLREQIERREAALREKDAAVAELVQQLAKFAKRALPPLPEADGLRIEFDRYRQSQRDVLERHETAIAGISETLGLVRDHLVLLRPHDERGSGR